MLTGAPSALSCYARAMQKPLETTSRPHLRVLFCAHPFERGAADPEFEAEVAAARALERDLAFLQIDPLIQRGDALAATRSVPPRDSGPAVYRGWMLRPDRYADLHSALEARGDVLVNAPEAYRHAHWLPESYGAIERWTARSAWLTVNELTLDRAVALARSFGPRALIVKDDVKSRKHEWPRPASSRTEPIRPAWSASCSVFSS